MSTSRRPAKRSSTQAKPKPHTQRGTQRQATVRQTTARPAPAQHPSPHGQTRGQTRGQAKQRAASATATSSTTSATGALPPITRASRAPRRWWREPRALAGIVAAALVVAGLVVLLAHQQASGAPGGAGTTTTARSSAPTATAHTAASPATTAKPAATTKPAAGSTGSPCGSTVAMDDDSFFFRSCTIKRGATLTFQNQSATETHVICSGFFQVCHPALDAPPELNDAAPVVLAPGARHSFTFTHAGVFNITCLAHGGMDITVTVTD